jgi:hypothetical protein
MQEFRIRRNFLLGLGLTGLLLVILLAVCILQQEKTAKVLILAALTLPVVGLLSESLRRKVVFSEDALIAHRLFRRKIIALKVVTSVDTVQVRRRAFVSISTEEDFLILSNNYENFGRLLQQLIEQLPDRVISEETRDLAANPPSKTNDLFSIWLAVVVLLLILYIQLGGSF